MDKNLIFFFIGISLSLGLFVWIVHSSIHLHDECIEKKCHYVDDIGMGQHGCMVDVVNDSSFGCEYLFQPCPEDKNTACYIYKNYTCPRIGSCINHGYEFQLTLGGVFLAFALIGSLLALVEILRAKSYERISG